MRDIISILERWTSDGTAIAVGSVVERIGSAPRDPGATLAVSVTQRSSLINRKPESSH